MLRFRVEHLVHNSPSPQRAVGESAAAAGNVTARNQVLDDARHLGENTTWRRYRREDGAERSLRQWPIESLSVAALLRSLATTGRPRGSRSC